MSREEIIAAVKDCATTLGHAPNVAELRALTKITKNQIRKNFGTYTQMMAASEVQREGSGCRVDLKSLFLDWAGIIRKLGRVPTMSDYELEGRYSIRPLVRRFQTWSQVPAGLLEYARQEGLEGEWKDVMEIITKPSGRGDEAGTDIRVPYDHAFPAQGAEGPNNLWRADACTAQLRSYERKWRDFCVWHGGERPGVFRYADSNSLP